MRRLIMILSPIVVLLACNYSREPECKGNCFNGFGIKQWKDGGYMKGIWRNGELYGEGIQCLGESTKFPGDVYKGNFDHGYDGFGTYYGKGSDFIYKGYWKNGKPDGYGESTFGPHPISPNHAGIKYAGHFENGKLEGYGKYYWPDGSRYEGQFSNDLFEGEATFIFTDGFVFKGTWHEGYNPDFLKALDLDSKHSKDKDSILIKYFYRKDNN